MYIYIDLPFNYGLGVGLKSRKLLVVLFSPGRVRHTRLATSSVMHMKAISSTIWRKEENKFQNKTECTDVISLDLSDFLPLQHRKIVSISICVYVYINYN